MPRKWSILLLAVLALPGCAAKQNALRNLQAGRTTRSGRLFPTSCAT